MLSGLDVSKGPGVDGLSAEWLRLAAPGISSSLAHLFNLCLRGSVVPRAWKMAHVTPVHKGGANIDISNFRPISVLPVIVKVLEKIVHEQLYNYLQANSILNQCQFGFRPNHITPDVLVSMTDEWNGQLTVENWLVLPWLISVKHLTWCSMTFC